MKKPYHAKWDTECSANFPTLSRAMGAVESGLYRTVGSLQRGAAEVSRVKTRGFPQELVYLAPIKEGR